ncbi:MAG: phosphatase PAP2 family protein [Bacteroidia bacterium]|nr:phosphatase PAP2 family protein [Bacteroidia bacterium]
MIEYLNHIDTVWFLAVNNGLENSFFNMICPFLREPKMWIPLYLILVYVWYKQFGTKAFLLLAIAGVLVGVADQFSANLIKNTFERLRPCNQPLLKDQVHLLVNCGKGFSFISAHATNHFALAIYVIVLMGNKFKFLYYAAPLWAASIAFSQVYVGVHYPFDVICGAIVGSILGFLFGKVTYHKLLKLA